MAAADHQDDVFIQEMWR